MMFIMPALHVDEADLLVLGENGAPSIMLQTPLSSKPALIVAAICATKSDKDPP